MTTGITSVRYQTDPRTLDGPCQPTREAAVPSVLGQLEGSINDLGNLLDGLAKKLGPVLHPESPAVQEKNGQCKASRGCELADRLDTLNQRLQTQYVMLNSIIERCEV